MKDREEVSRFHFRVDSLNNGSFVATFIGAKPVNFSGDIQDLVPKNVYDDTGALYYVIIVVFIYGFSIILMIGSLIKKSEADSGIVYMKEMETLRRVERRREKFKTRLVMSQRRLQNALKLSRSADAESTGSASDKRPTSGWDTISLDWNPPGSARRQDSSSWSLVSDAEDGAASAPTSIHPSPRLGVGQRSPGQQAKPEVTVDMPEDCDPGNALLSAAFAIPLLPKIALRESLSLEAAGAKLDVAGTNYIIPSVVVEEDADNKRPPASPTLDPVQEVEEEAFAV